MTRELLWWFNCQLKRVSNKLYLYYLQICDLRYPKNPCSSRLSYRYFNVSQLQAIESALNKLGYSLVKFNSILEMGFGMGRHTRHLLELCPKAAIYCTEIEMSLIKQCQKKFPTVNFIHSNVRPPLTDVQSDSIDFIFSWGVFTNMSEEGHIAWLKELASKLRSGGIMFHMISSESSLNMIKKFSSRFGKNMLEYCKGYVYGSGDYFYTINIPKKPEYGLAIIPKSYVMKNWENYTGLKILDYLDCAYQGYPLGVRDFVIMQKQ